MDLLKKAIEEMHPSCSICEVLLKALPYPGATSGSRLWLCPKCRRRYSITSAVPFEKDDV